jgi:hypothetical protein
MKNKSTLITLSLAITCAFITSCNSPEQKVEAAEIKVEEATQDLEEAKYDYVTEYNSFKAESDLQITANEQLIADLKAYSANKKKEEKAALEQKIQVLEEKNKTMKEKVKEYKEDGKEKWQSFKREFKHDMDELGQALKDLTQNNSK